MPRALDRDAIKILIFMHSTYWGPIGKSGLIGREEKFLLRNLRNKKPQETPGFLARSALALPRFTAGTEAASPGHRPRWTEPASGAGRRPHQSTAAPASSAGDHPHQSARAPEFLLFPPTCCACPTLFSSFVRIHIR